MEHADVCWRTLLTYADFRRLSHSSDNYYMDRLLYMDRRAILISSGIVREEAGPWNELLCASDQLVLPDGPASVCSTGL